MKGTQSRSTVEEFYGLGAEQKHKTKFTFDSDHPEIFASEDSGATPVEIVLAGLAGCLTAGIAAVAQARDIQLRCVSATLEAGMDIRGILGADPDVRNGFDGIKVLYKIDADASPDDIKALVAQSQKRSAVYDIIANPTNVTVEVEVRPQSATQCAPRPSSSAPARPDLPRVGGSPGVLSITCCWNAARSPTPGRLSAGIP